LHVTKEAMPRKRRAEVDDDDSQDVENVGRLRTNVQHSDENNFFDEEDDDDDVETMGGTQKVGMFTSQLPEMTQDILQVKESERSNLFLMTENQREKVLCDLSRLVLFKALVGDAIDRTKCIKEAGISSEARISSAAFDEVKVRLNDCFGFEVKRIPLWMEKIKGVSKMQKDRYYVTNGLEADGSHSKALHAVHEQSSIEKGFLMVVLGFVYCKGDSRNDGSRWIHDKDLYNLLHRLDENIPPNPPTINSKRSKSASASMSQISSRQVGGEGVAQTPDVDTLLCKFCHRDYLIKEKANEEQITASNATIDENSFFYSMGPRAAIEIGRRQVIYFCSEILDEEPDPTMLQELEAQLDDAEIS
jgi:MAGE family